MSLLEFCEKLPKVELHAHLNGSLSRDTLIALGTPEYFLHTYQITNATPGTATEKLDECFHLFAVAHAATSTKEAVYTATKRTIEEFFNDNVIYLELRTTPREEGGMSKVDYIESVVQAIRDNPNPIVVKLTLSLDRRHDVSDSDETLDVILDMKEKYPGVVKGLDLCGNPNEGGFHEYLFVRARACGLKITLHCGEVRNHEEVTEMLNFKPNRIGHGTCIHPNYGGSKEIWNLYRAKPIPIECCLTSNLKCGTSRSYQEHPMKELLRKDLPLCINTDDKGVFDTSLSKEYFHAAENFNLSREALVKCSLKAVDYCFALNEEKKQLKERIKNWAEENSELFNFVDLNKE